MRFLRDGVALLRLLADAEQADGGIVAAEDALGVDRAEPRELDEARRAEQSTLAPESRTTTGRFAVGKGVAIAGLCRPGVQLKEQRRRGHLRAGVAGGDEGICLTFYLK